MADSIREQIVAEIFLRIGRIQTSAGFETNIGTNAFRWKTTEIQADELPAVVLRDVRQTLQPRVSANKHDWDLEIEIDAIFAPTSTVAQQLNKAQADIIKAIGPEWRFEVIGLPNCTIQPVGDETRVIQADRVLAALQSRWLVKYRTASFDPFNI